MKLGTLGILDRNIFDKNSIKFVDNSYAYLTIAHNATEDYKNKYPKIGRTIFESRWYLLEEKSDTRCVAMYLSESLVPDEVISIGEDFKISSMADNKWKYFKVLLSFNDKIEVVYLHEKSLGLFTWIHTEEIGSHEDDPFSLLP